MSEPVGNGPRIGGIQGNSHKAREAQEQKAPMEPREKLEKIVVGKVVTRKPAWYKRLGRSIIADDAHNVGDYILVDVVVPAVKNLLYDMLVGGAQRTLWGSARNAVGRRSVIGASPSSIHTRYDKMAEEPPRGRSLSYAARSRHDFDEIILDSRAEAEDIIARLEFMIDKYDQVTVAELYELLGVTERDWASRNYGWLTLRNADVRQVSRGFLLDLPAPEPLR